MPGSLIEVTTWHLLTQLLEQFWEDCSGDGTICSCLLSPVIHDLWPDLLCWTKCIHIQWLEQVQTVVHQTHECYVMFLTGFQDIGAEV